MDQDGSALPLPRCYPKMREGANDNMPTVTLIARGIAGLEAPAAGRIEYFDKATPGFALRVTASGHRSWVCLYRHKGEVRRYTLGGFPKLGLGDAREKAKEILHRAAKGEDPAPA